MTTIDDGSTLGVDLPWMLAGAPSVMDAMRRLTAHFARASRAAAAGLTAADVSGFRTFAATDQLAESVDALQYRLGGPCVDVFDGTERVLYLPDVAAEHERPSSRWHRFAAIAVAETPLRSLVSYRVSVGSEHPIASLNLYATEPDAFPAEVIATTEAAVQQAAVALAYQVERATRLELEVALQTNRRIGAAVGVVMSAERLGYDRAFAVLRQASQHTNRKLHDVAEDVLTSGAPPPVAPDGRGRAERHDV